MRYEEEDADWLERERPTVTQARLVTYASITRGSWMAFARRQHELWFGAIAQAYAKEAP